MMVYEEIHYNSGGFLNEEYLKLIKKNFQF